MKVDLTKATELWKEAIARADWNDKWTVLRVAGMSGLGVLSTEAMDHAMACIRADCYESRRFSPELLAQLGPEDAAARWAEHLLKAAERFPVPAGRYPLRAPEGHVVGTPPCFGRGRDEDWTAGCLRAAWGNTFPYGLETAIKRCPGRGCGREMRYWCQRRKADEAEFRWTVDHVVAHAVGGCCCHFNLAALCPTCNSAKGKR